jgi:ActR/RegA family two-component response regulator
MYLVSSLAESRRLNEVSESPGRGAARLPGGPVVLIADDGLFSAALLVALRQRRLDARALPAGDCTALLDRARRSEGGVVVLDLRPASDPTGVETVAMVRPLTRAGWTVLVLGESPGDDARSAAAVAAGAVGVLAKTSSLGSMLRTVGAAAEGQCIMTLAERRLWAGRYRECAGLARELAALFGIDD